MPVNNQNAKLNGHNASHYFYISPVGKPEWSKEFEKKDNSDLLGFDPFTDRNKLINCKTYFKHLNLPFAKGFGLTTTYPGLLIGAGYSHYAIEKEDFQLGFFFDHTIGIPIIPGSTVKGILKSVFPKEEKDKKKREGKRKYILGLAKLDTDISEKIINELLEEIFFKNGNVFFHAFPIAIDNNNVGDEKKLLTDDAITPHHPGDPDAIFKEPIPLKFIKVPAGVTFKFQFRINNYNEDGIELSSETIKEVFKQILLDFGICAKRNVGYGQFTENVSVNKNEQSANNNNIAHINDTDKIRTSSPKQSIPSETKLIKNEKFGAVICEKSEGYFCFKFTKGDKEIKLCKKIINVYKKFGEKGIKEELNKNDKVVIKIQKDSLNSSENIAFSVLPQE